jgi:hypothetical protein
MKNNAVPITDHDPARTARNRANAAHSTGPKTEAGKQRSCLNAMRHGLTGHTIVLPVEDLVAYQGFTNQPIRRRLQTRRHPRKAASPIPRRHIVAAEPHSRSRE